MNAKELQERLDRATDLVHGVLAGTHPLTLADLSAVFDYSHVLEMMPEPSDARFARTSLDEIINVTMAARIRLEIPTMVPCTRCNARGRVLEHDRQIPCPLCNGTGQHMPANTDAVVVFVYPANWNVPPDRVNFRTESEARQYFDRLSARLVAPPPRPLIHGSGGLARALRQNAVDHLPGDVAGAATQHAPETPNPPPTGAAGAIDSTKPSAPKAK